MIVLYTADESEVSMVSPPCGSEETTPATPALPPLRLRFSVFIDGTGNNMFNTQTRLETRRARDASFRNDYSNIAKLANYIETPNSTNNYHVPVYVEGMGTEHGASDDINGMAFGTFGRGIVTRVTSCIRQIANETHRLGVDSNHVITQLKIDVFGFSRGAAAARHFIHRVFNDVPDGTVTNYSLITLIRNRWNPGNSFELSNANVTIPFVGLYDCVASFRVNGLLGALGSISNDTEELHLDSLAVAQKVTHIIASDEFRLNFPVTNIVSAGGNGTTIHVPGVHSDVGGGYNSISESTNGMREKNLPILRLPFAIADGWDVIRPIQRRFAAEIDRLVALGWYTRDEFVIEPTYNPESPNSILAYDSLRVNRRNIRNSYTRVTLKLMKTEASRAGLNFPNLESENPLTGILSQAYSYINSNRGRSADEWINDLNPMMLQLRHGYFHTSSHYSAATGGGTDWPVYPMGSQFYSTAYQYEDSARNVIVGERKRIEYRG